MRAIAVAGELPDTPSLPQAATPRPAPGKFGRVTLADVERNSWRPVRVLLDGLDVTDRAVELDDEEGWADLWDTDGRGRSLGTRRRHVGEARLLINVGAAPRAAVVPPTDYHFTSTTGRIRIPTAGGGMIEFSTVFKAGDQVFVRRENDAFSLVVNGVVRERAQVTESAVGGVMDGDYYRGGARA